MLPRGAVVDGVSRPGLTDGRSRIATRLLDAGALRRADVGERHTTLVPAMRTFAA